MNYRLLATISIAAFSLNLASAEELMVPPDSELWNEIYEPDSTVPVEIDKSDPLRKTLFDLARPMLEKSAGTSILFSGSLKGYRNWALFQGSTLDKSGVPVHYPDDGTSDTVALFMKAAKGWVLVSYSGGHSDVFYEIWIEQYGMPRDLLGY